jgi:hypothetical protein
MAVLNALHVLTTTQSVLWKKVTQQSLALGRNIDDTGQASGKIKLFVHVFESVILGCHPSMHPSDNTSEKSVVGSVDGMDVGTLVGKTIFISRTPSSSGHTSTISHGMEEKCISQQALAVA